MQCQISDLEEQLQESLTPVDHVVETSTDLVSVFPSVSQLNVQVHDALLTHVVTKSTWAARCATTLSSLKRG